MKTFYARIPYDTFLSDVLKHLLHQYGYQTTNLEAVNGFYSFQALTDGTTRMVTDLNELNYHRVLTRIEDVSIYLKSIYLSDKESYHIAKDAVLKLANNPEKGITKQELQAIFKTVPELEQLFYIAMV